MICTENFVIYDKFSANENHIDGQNKNASFYFMFKFFFFRQPSMNQIIINSHSSKNNYVLDLWNMEVYCCIYKGSPLKLNRNNSSYSLAISWKSIQILYSNLRLHPARSLIPIGSSVKMLWVFVPSCILKEIPPYLNIPDLIILNILGERYKLWSSSLWKLLPILLHF